MIVVEVCCRGVPGRHFHPAHGISPQPTLSGRGWLVSPFGTNPWWLSVAAALPALLLSILIFMDQQITAVILNRAEYRLQVRLPGKDRHGGPQTPLPASRQPPLPTEGSWLPPGPLLCGCFDAVHIGTWAAMVRLSHCHLLGPHRQSSEREQSLRPWRSPQFPGHQVKPIMSRLG